MMHEHQKLLSDDQMSLIMRVHDDHYMSIEQFESEEYHLPNLKNIDLRIEWGFINWFLDKLQVKEVRLNSLVGLSWPYHCQMLDTIGALSCRKSYFAHDYSQISHYYQLLDPEGVFRGRPNFDQLVQWNRSVDTSGSTDPCEPAERHRAYRQFFAKCDRIEAPSKTAADILKQVYPEAVVRIVPHDDHLPECHPASRRPADGTLKIAMVGALGHHKGSKVLESLAFHAHDIKLPVAYSVIGYSDRDAILEQYGVSIEGRYDSESDVFDKIDEIQPDLIFISSIWPETYCYTLSIALKKRVPTVVFDIGAQAERVENVDWARALPIELAQDPIALTHALQKLPIDELWARAQEGS